MKMHFILNKITGDFAAVLRRHLLDTGDRTQIWTAVDFYVCEDMNIPDDPAFGYPTNHMDDRALNRLTTKIVDGLFKIAALMDAAADQGFDSDEELEDHLRSAMKADAEMTAAKDWIKGIYMKKNDTLRYPTVDELSDRDADTFRRFLTVGRTTNGAGSVYASTLGLLH